MRSMSWWPGGGKRNGIDWHGRRLVVEGWEGGRCRERGEGVGEREGEEGGREGGREDG